MALLLYRRNSDAAVLAALFAAFVACAPGVYAAKVTSSDSRKAVAETSQASPIKKRTRATQAESKSPSPVARATPTPKPVNPADAPDVPETDPLPREALAAMFAGDRTRLAETYRAALQREQATNDQRSLRTSDAIQYLYDNSLKDREEFLRETEIALAQARSSELKTLIGLSLLSDEIYELNTVEHKNRFNKFTRVFNRASSSLSQLVMLQPQAAVQLVWDGIYSVRKAKPATENERKMVYLATNFLKKYPDAPEAPEVKNLLAELQQKLNADRAARGKTTGQLAMKQAKYATAEYHLEKAAILNPADAETSQLLQQARAMRIRTDDAQCLTLTVGGAEQQMNDEDASALAQACRAVATGDGKALQRLASTASGVWDSIMVALAANAEAAGQHESAIQQLANIAQQAPQTAGGRAASANLRNTDYNLDEQFAKAVRDLSAAQRKYFITGNRSTEDTTYQVGSAVIQQGSNVATGLPLLGGADIAVRAITEQFKATVDVDPVIDAGAKYLRKYPKSARTREIATQLAELAKKSGEYQKSEDYLTESGAATPEQLAKLREKKAVKLYEQASQTGDLIERRRLLQELIQNYGDSKIVQKSAGKELARIAPNLSPDSIVLIRKMLQKDPSIATSLGISPLYVDGAKSNGELAEEGLTINPSGGTFDYKFSGEDAYRTAALPAGDREPLLARARQLQRDYTTQEQGRTVVTQQKVPFAIDGGVGSTIDVAPQLVPSKADPRDKKRFE